ncbi:LolA family protein [Entomobacter blattae]|uniref:Outer-membrane lipoprotein carrier protein n=1 Tax=Entomobacter blattae TaxID=2762277 RepID=A0A7H1NQH4_9PROT|nr:outer-membrane lipoprotein carrier protein LolA [Entomobacter blattae]QNT78034.1 Outer-membrane lipoprotein carrier protein [Entomobacter blattae]
MKIIPVALAAGVYGLVGGVSTQAIAKSPTTITIQTGERVAPLSLTAAQQAWVKKVEDWMNSVSTLKARFQQIAQNGSRTTGDAWIERPGKMRFQYDKPSPLLLVANEGKLIFNDSQLDQTTTIPLNKTPLGLLLRENLRLSGDVTITGFQQTNGFVMVRVIRSNAPGEGNLTLVFWQNPFALRGWRVVDAQGRQTQVDLFELQKGEEFPSSLFSLDIGRNKHDE